MRNEQLRQALIGAGLTNEQVAAEVGIDPKTVQRWVTLGRVPHPRHQRSVAELLGTPEATLWPEGTGPRVELVQLYAARADVPVDMWTRLLDVATETFDMLVYAALFLPEQQPRLFKALRDKADAGLKARLLFGDPDAAAVAQRGADEAIGDAVPAKVRNALAHIRAFADEPGIEVRLHSTTLYTSIYRFDDDMLVNPHVYGLPAAQAPALHLHRTPTGRLFDTYTSCFERVWGNATPWPGG